MAKEKSKKKTTRPKAKQEKSLLKDHPEVKRSARDYFRHENGKTIVEDRVARGDADPYTQGQPNTNYDLTDDDLRSLAAYAKDLVDATLYRYDEKTANVDALNKAINEKDGGKYAGKLNANTVEVILDHMSKEAKKPTEDKGQSDNGNFMDKKASEYMEVAASSQPEEVTMSRSDEIKAMEEKLASLKAEEAKESMGDIAAKVANDPAAREQFKALMKEAMGKEAGSKAGPGIPDGTGPHGGTDKCQKAEEKEAASCKKSQDTAEEIPAKGEEKKEASSKTASEKIVEELDKIAGDLESKKDFDLFKVAFQIDKVSDVLLGKKEAKTLESDPDEGFMRQHFEAGLKEGDADEKKYMGEFNTDNTTEVDKAAGKKTASEKRPYAIVSQD